MFNQQNFEKYKHFSFDLWLTLIKSNKEFKLKRSILFKEFFGINNEINEIHKVIKYYDDCCNSINEVTGGNIDTFQIYGLILNHFNATYDIFLLNDFYDETEKLFYNYPPEKINQYLYDLLEKNKSEGKSSNILSNTGFIKGTTIRQVLKDMEILNFFDFHIFSDEVKMSKPNHEIFDLMISSVDKNISLNEVIHIGDNVIADYQSAVSYGINAYLVKNEK
ncbi:HAD family hydrolase [Empedobacter falsenii]|uniref:HAD family hydrolase n=1 Tax=Empedobacter falsenii TaxID=343874 RepID=A0ABY8V9R2_9FLAO|nr:HAD family hydrolase [Empedobacter falsenii]WIH98361.1 HAD family hydrolase [Empedobacter falsenii]